MRFKIQPVPTAQEVLDAAFKHTRQATPSFSKRIRKKERWAKEIEKSKVETVSRLLDERLRQIVNSFPDFDALSPFYRELTNAAINLSETRQQLSNLKKKAKIIQRLRSQTVQAMFASNFVPRIRKLSQSFYGRTSSVVKKLDKDLKALEQKRKQLLELPEVKTDCFSVVLAGFPNVGKTTLLKKLSGSEPRIAAFPFTTKSLKFGYWKEKYWSVQLIDTPGLLDRTAEKRNAIEQKAVAALRHLGNAVFFVCDPSLSSGFSLEQQHNLWKNLKSDFSKKKMLVVITKADLCSAEQITEAEKLFPNAFRSDEDEKIRSWLHEEGKQWLKQQQPLFTGKA